MTTTAATAHYTLSVETTHLTSPEGEAVEIIDLMAVDHATGRRFVYVGPAACGTHGEALDIIARIFAWERSHDRTFDPTRKPEFWVGLAGVDEIAGDAGDVAHDGRPETADTPSVWTKRAANTVEVVERVEAVRPAVLAHGDDVAAPTTPASPRKARTRRVDAAKSRRARARVAAEAGEEFSRVGG